MAKEGEGKINEALRYNEKLFKKIRELIGESGIWEIMQ